MPSKTLLCSKTKSRSLLILNPPKWFKDLAGAWIFYTILPSWPWLKPNFNQIARFAPLLGLIVGALQSLLWITLSKFGWPKESLALITIAFGIWVTGGIHIDGLIDTSDGLGAGQEKCVEAMKDSRIGASGAISILLVILLQVASLIKLGNLSPFLLPIVNFWGRCSPFWAISKFRYLHNDVSSSFHKDNWEGWNDLKPSIFIMVILFAIIKTIRIHPSISRLIFLSIPIGIITSISIAQIIGNRLRGHSGDSYGASVVLTETAILLTFAII